MTTYTKRDIRAADMLAMILFGFGVVLVAFAVVKTIAEPDVAAKVGKVNKEPGSLAGLWVVAGVFLLLGTALNLKIRQLVRNKGQEPKDYDGVPD